MFFGGVSHKWQDTFNKAKIFLSGFTGQLKYFLLNKFTINLVSLGAKSSDKQYAPNIIFKAATSTKFPSPIF